MDKKENEKRELNEFELALISGGGNASFPAQVFSSEEKKQQLADTVGANVAQIDQCLKDEKQVRISPMRVKDPATGKVIENPTEEEIRRYIYNLHFGTPHDGMNHFM